MGNNNSFLNNATNYFDKIIKQRYISKSEILKLKKMIKNLSEEDKSYKKLFNRITTISNRAEGKNDSIILTEFYETFQKEAAKNKRTDSLPEAIWTTKDYENIPEGSCIYVKSQTHTVYKGTWSYMGGTYPIEIPKNLCSETSNLKRTLQQVSEHLRSKK